MEAKNEFCPHVNVEECIMEVEAGNFQRVMECPSHSIKYLSSMIADRDPKNDPDIILTHSDGSTGKKISKLLYFDSLCSSQFRSHYTAVFKRKCKEAGVRYLHHKASQSHVPFQ